MGSVVYQYLRVMFGTKTTTKVSELIDTVLTSLSTFFTENGAAYAVLQILMGVGASLLIIFLFMDMLDKASKDMFTLEKLVITFIRFFITFALLLFLPNLLTKGFQFTSGLYHMVSEKTDTFSGGNEDGVGIIFFKGTPKAEYGWKGVPEDKDWHVSYKGSGKKNEWSFVQVLAQKKKKYVDPKTPDEKDKKKEEEGKNNDHTRIHGAELPDDTAEAPAACFYSGMTGITKNFGVFLICVIGWIAGFVAELVTMFMVVSNALQLLVRTLFAPIAVVQCFDEGQRSTGIRFLKKFFATGLTFAIILGVLYMAQYFTASLMTSALDVKEGTKEVSIGITEFRNFMETPSKQILILLSRFAVVGMIMGASRLADEVFGVH